ncbi:MULTISPECIES: NmrA family NAD(P)-binding protein [Flammeovirga]|uniref:NAD(P)H-binding protein n=1 Tax=Flammeovirga agarivorans TaxID=2726742 RepID=A0A7X8XU34_9BACT|nr:MULTISPECIES: NAD(P)H-binding protein [Flammeovirga]NLR89958.1 NAD(P)H-binding protein [Flammeovirga agarivorans]
MDIEKQNILITAPRSIISASVMHRAIRSDDFNVFTGQRSVISNKDVTFRTLDFHQAFTYRDALKDIDVVFLCVPDSYSSFDKIHYQNFIKACELSNIKKIVMSSIFNAQKTWYLPIGNVEKMLEESQLNYSIIRSTVFMQNLITYFKSDITKDQKLFVPNYQTKLNWIDALDVAKVILMAASDHQLFKNEIVTITGPQNKNFMEVTAKLTASLPFEIEHSNKLPTSLRGKSWKDKLILFFLPALILISKKVKPTNQFEEITGRPPRTLSEFIMRKLPELMPEKEKTKKLTLL